MAQVLTSKGADAYANRSLELSGAVPYTKSIAGSVRRQLFKSILVDINGGATVTLTAAIPAGAFNILVAARVVTIIAGSDGVASWFFGATGDTDQWGSALALAAGTLVTPANYTAFVPTGFAAATDIIISGTGGKLIESGQVRVEIWYELISAPTS
jgi:hypothetical protein